MKKKRIIMTCVIAIALAACTVQATPTPVPLPTPIPPTAEAVLTPTEVPPLWEKVDEIESPHVLRVAAFVGPEFGITGGPNTEGQANTTLDGGQTWVTAQNSSGCLWGLDLIDTQTIWECNASDARVSTDGGLNWNDAPRGMGTPGCKISAVDGQTALYLTPQKLFLTTDGGVTRSVANLPENVKVTQVLALSLRTPTEGYLLDLSGNLHFTSDSAATWKIMTTLDLSKYGEMKLIYLRGLPSAAIRFFDANNGVVVIDLVGGGANKVVALRTSDGGQTWTEEEVAAEFGPPYLTRDGQYLTVVSSISLYTIQVFRYTGGLIGAE